MFRSHFVKCRNVLGTTSDGFFPDLYTINDKRSGSRLDIPGLDINGSTIPPDVLVTLSRPDLVLLNRNEKLIFLLELTCSFETNVLAAHARKTTNESRH